MNSFLPRLRSSSQNRNYVFSSTDNKPVNQEEEILETDKDIRIKANSDKQQQKLWEISHPQQIDVVQNKKRAISVGRKYITSRTDTNQNTNQLFNMLSSQRSKEVKSIETQRSKISENIRFHQNRSIQKQHLNNQETSINSCGEKTEEIQQNNTLKNSFIKYPYQIGGGVSSSNNKNNNLYMNCQYNQVIFDENMTCNSNSTLNNENIDQVYQFYTGFENENITNQNCFYPPITKNTPFKSYKDSKTSATQNDVGSQNDFNTENIQKPNNINYRVNRYSVSNNDIDYNQNSQNTTPFTKQYHKHKFVVSLERRNKETKNENTPPKSHKLAQNFNSNNSSKSKLQNQGKQRSISQNYHLYNPNTIQSKFQNSQGNQSLGTTSLGTTGCNSEAGEFLNCKNYQNNQINTQTMALLDNTGKDGYFSISSKPKNITENRQQNNQNTINEHSCDKNFNMEKVGQKSIIMKVGKKMIKILNPYKNPNSGDKKNSIEQRYSDSNRTRANSNQTTDQNQNSSSDGSPSQNKSNEEIIKIEQQNPIFINNNNQVTPSKEQTLPFYFNYNQGQKSAKTKQQIKPKVNNEELLNVNKKELNIYQTEKTTDSSSKENEMNHVNACQTDSQDTQDEDDYKPKANDKNNKKNIVKVNYKQVQKYIGQKKYQILKQNQYINSCFDTPILKPAQVQRKRAPSQDMNSYKINDIMTIMSESQDSFNLDDQLSIVGGNCDLLSLASTIRSIVSELVV